MFGKEDVLDIARGSAMESAAILDALLNLELLSKTRVEEGKAILNEIYPFRPGFLFA